MKISKLLPITMLVALGMSVTASQALEASDPLTYQLSLPEYIKIDSSSTKPTADLTFSDDYEGFSYTGAMDATFRDVSNAPEKNFLLTESAIPSGVGTLNALSKDGKYIVFVNTQPGSIPSDTQIQNATDAPAAADNPNCFGLSFTLGAATNTLSTAQDNKITPTYEVVGDIPGEGEAVDSSARALQFTLTNGITTLPFTFGTSNDVTNTFSLHDTLGTYQAVLTMTEVPL